MTSFYIKDGEFYDSNTKVFIALEESTPPSGLKNRRTWKSSLWLRGNLLQTVRWAGWSTERYQYLWSNSFLPLHIAAVNEYSIITQKILPWCTNSTNMYLLKVIRLFNKILSSGSSVEGKQQSTEGTHRCSRQFILKQGWNNVSLYSVQLCQ